MDDLAGSYITPAALDPWTRIAAIEELGVGEVQAIGIQFVDVGEVQIVGAMDSNRRLFDELIICVYVILLACLLIPEPAASVCACEAWLEARHSRVVALEVGAIARWRTARRLESRPFTWSYMGWTMWDAKWALKATVSWLEARKGEVIGDIGDSHPRSFEETHGVETGARLCVAESKFEQVCFYRP